MKSSTMAGALITGVLLMPSATSAIALSGSSEVSITGVNVDTALEASGSTTGEMIELRDRGEIMEMNIGGSEEASVPPEDGTYVTLSNSVSTQADLEVFREQAMNENGNVAELDLESDNRVNVEYKHRGKFLWLFPVTVKSHTSVTREEDGSVKVETAFPWWRVFVSGTGDAKQRVEKELSDSLDIQSHLSANTWATAKAQIATTVIGELDDTADLQAVASIDVE